MKTKSVRITERDGFERKAVPCTFTVDLDRGAFHPGGPARLFDPEGQEQAIQVDAVRAWEDGSVRTADVTFSARIPARGERVFKFEYGEGATPEAKQLSPIEVRDGGDPVEVQQGPVIYQVRRKGFNLVDQMIFGEKLFLRPGSRGIVLVLKDGQELLPEGEARIETETRGPRAGRLRVEGVYPGGFGFVTRITCFSRVSWILAEHEVVSGDVAQIASVIVESDFNLPAAPLSTAFGARQRGDGKSTTWAVVTDWTSTVDVAVVGAWSDAGSVRYESGPDGRFRAIFPFEQKPCILYYHYLITPPMDHVHSPAPSMATDPECRVLS
ncbi:MAG: hypothetical protein EXS64_01135 [Candidatus Latescibacteria bacterium]|nr:hypothetical protein [Candidatus Latescibacterota bacterium]